MSKKIKKSEKLNIKFCECGKPPAIWKSGDQIVIACMTPAGCHVKSVRAYNELKAIEAWNELRTSHEKKEITDVNSLFSTQQSI